MAKTNTTSGRAKTKQGKPKASATVRASARQGKRRERLKPSGKSRPSERVGSGAKGDDQARTRRALTPDQKQFLLREIAATWVAGERGWSALRANWRQLYSGTLPGNMISYYSRAPRWRSAIFAYAEQFRRESLTMAPAHPSYFLRRLVHTFEQAMDPPGFAKVEVLQWTDEDGHRRTELIKYRHRPDLGAANEALRQLTNLGKAHADIQRQATGADRKTYR